tara:strand:- start:792 stop:1937 length:1146 start_codon:yes stop_codon:yes gene_type:complete
MQNFWKYLDDLIGKGLETNLILELIIYASANLIPITLPLSVLLSSMMVIGNLSEKYELISIKASGISFFQIIKPLFLISIIIAIFSFMFSNYIIPYSNLKNTSLMYDIIHKKLAFNLEEGVFFDELDGFSIKIDEKVDDITFKNITILNRQEDKSINTFYIADSAIIQNDERNNMLNIKLKNGKSYAKEDCLQEKRKDDKCFMISKFKSYSLNFDLSSFLLERSNTDKFNDKAKTMNISELKYLKDSLEKNINKSYLKLDQINEDSNIQKSHIINLTNKEIDSELKYLNKIKVELNKKYTIALSCIIMLLIGAPIGVYIKKGGFGLPVIFSIIIFLFFYIISTTGYRLVKENILSVEIGIWLPIIVFFIIALTITFNTQKK